MNLTYYTLPRKEMCTEMPQRATLPPTVMVSMIGTDCSPSTLLARSTDRISTPGAELLPRHTYGERVLRSQTASALNPRRGESWLNKVIFVFSLFLCHETVKSRVFSPTCASVLQNVSRIHLDDPNLLMQHA